MENYKILAVRIKQLRTIKGMTQNEFCEVVGFTQATLSAYENATKDPSLDILLKITQKFNISLDWLLGLSDKISDEIMTVSDVIETLIEIDKKTELLFFQNTETIKEIDHVTGYPKNYIQSFNELAFVCEDLNSFLKEWDKMRSLRYKENVIDDDVYNLWIEKCITKYKGAYLDPNIEDLLS